MNHETTFHNSCVRGAFCHGDGSRQRGHNSLWTIEDKPPRLAKQQAMADEFKEKTGITVEVIPVKEEDLQKEQLLHLLQVIYLM